MATDSLLTLLVVPVNSAAHWSHLYDERPPLVLDLRDEADEGRRPFGPDRRGVLQSVTNPQ